MLAFAAAPAHAGTYDVPSCGAPGAGGVNRAWTLRANSDPAYWDVVPACPALSVFSKRAAGGVLIPYFSGAAFEAVAPAGAILDRMVIWRNGYEFSNHGAGQIAWEVAGYRGDYSVLGGPIAGETCVEPPPGAFNCRLGAEAPMSAESRVERDLETDRVVYAASCFRQGGCQSANADGYPFAGVQIFGSVITVREDNPPAVGASGPLLAGGWRTDDDPLEVAASDPVAVRRVRVLVDGAEARVVDSACDATRMAPCPTAVRPSIRLGLADGVHAVGVEATDSAGNVARADHTVAVDRNPPALAFAPSRGGRTIVVDAADPGSGVASGAIAVRRGRTFRALRTRLAGGRLIARLRRGSRRGRTFQATATDNLGRTSTILGER